MTEPLIMICAPVRDRQWILPDYLDRIVKLDYPKKNIAIRFVINDSSDKSDDILVEFKNKYKEEYRDITLYRYDLGAPEDGRTKRNEKGLFTTLSTLRNLCIDLLDGEEYWLSIDTDVLVGPTLLKKFLSHDKFVIAALVKNSPSNIYNILNKIKGTDKLIYSHVNDFEFGKLIEIDATGACCLYHKNVITTAKFEYHEQGEDLGMSNNIQKYGYKLYCDTTIGLATHVMDKVSWQKDKTLNYNWAKNKQV